MHTVKELLLDEGEGSGGHYNYLKLHVVNEPVVSKMTAALVDTVPELRCVKVSRTLWILAKCGTPVTLSAHLDGHLIMSEVTI